MAITSRVFIGLPDYNEEIALARLLDRIERGAKRPVAGHVDMHIHAFAIEQQKCLNELLQRKPELA